MFRKSIIAIAATATIVAASLPSTASAKKWRGWYGVGVGLAVVGATVAASCYRYEWVPTPYGWRRALVNRCYPY